MNELLTQTLPRRPWKKVLPWKRQLAYKAVGVEAEGAERSFEKAHSNRRVAKRLPTKYLHKKKLLSSREEIVVINEDRRKASHLGCKLQRLMPPHLTGRKQVLRLIGQISWLTRAITHVGMGSTLPRHTGLLRPRALMIILLLRKESERDFQRFKDFSSLFNLGCQLSSSVGTVLKTTPKIFILWTQVRPRGSSTRFFHAPNHIASVFDLISLAPNPFFICLNDLEQSN